MSQRVLNALRSADAAGPEILWLDGERVADRLRPLPLAVPPHHDPELAQEPDVTVPATAAARPIPQPPDFRVCFEPGEDRLLWERDGTHFPGQLTPFEAEFSATLIGHGMTHALERYAVPLAGVKVRALHGYVYNASSRSRRRRTRSPPCLRPTPCSWAAAAAAWRRSSTW
jgi:hypothetical protein